MKSPFFSVVIATFNREKTIERAINSLINQAEKDWEVIIIDDGSEDNTQEILANLTSKIKEISIIYQENKGVVNAKNRGGFLAKGKYITFLDSDDEYAQNHLQSRKAILLKNEKVDLLHGGVKIIGNQYVSDVNNPQKQIHLSECTIGGTFFFKNDTFQRLKGFSGDDFEADAELMRRIKKNDLEVLTTDKPTYIYHREDEDSITKNFLEQTKRL